MVTYRYLNLIVANKPQILNNIFQGTVTNDRISSILLQPTILKQQYFAQIDQFNPVSKLNIVACLLYAYSKFPFVYFYRICQCCKECPLFTTSELVLYIVQIFIVFFIVDEQTQQQNELTAQQEVDTTAQQSTRKCTKCKAPMKGHPRG